jgi:hypothetical protein
VYLGHDSGMNCPVVRILSSGKVIHAKDVLFREGSFKHLRALQEGRPEDVEPSNIYDLTDEPEQHDSLDLSSPVEDIDLLRDDPEADSNGLRKSTTSYELRSITDSRVDAGVKQYRCKWTGYSTQTWEPATDIEQDAPDAVKAYESFVENRAQARTTRSRSAAQQQQTPAASAHPSGDDSEDESEVLVAAAYAARCL